MQLEGTGTAVRHDEDLFLAWRLRGSVAAREQLVERYLPLARRLARRYAHSSEPLDDLVQVASVGLLHAIDRYDSGRGGVFAKYAVPTILGEMRRYFRDSGWALHVPRAAKERALAVRDAAAFLSSLHGRSPTAGQLAEYLELELDAVLDALIAMYAYETCPLDAPRAGPDGLRSTYAETLGEEDERLELIECDAALCAAFACLSAHDRSVLHMRYVQDLTQAEIGERIGVSQMQVSRILKRAADRVRAIADPATFPQKTHPRR